MLKKGMTQLGVGMALGLGLGLVMARQLQVALFQVNRSHRVRGDRRHVHPRGVARAMIPALRATRVNLVEALRP